jgi:hypothetical protein
MASIAPTSRIGASILEICQLAQNMKRDTVRQRHTHRQQGSLACLHFPLRMKVNQNRTDSAFILPQIHYHWASLEGVRRHPASVYSSRSQFYKFRKAIQPEWLFWFLGISGYVI